MHVSVVVCTHNRYDLCTNAIKSLIGQDAPVDYDIIVVDNSEDGLSAKRFASRFSAQAVTFIHTTTIGLSNARNIGARAATAPIVAYLDDDAVAEPGWVRAIAEAFARNAPEAGVVGGPVRPIWIEPRPSWMSEHLLESIAIIDRGSQTRPIGPGEWLAGCNIAFARDMLLEVGGFDPKLGRIGNTLLSNEETAVCERIRAMGRTIIYTPDAVVGHVIPPARATVQYLRRRVAWQAVSDGLAYPQRARERAVANRGRRRLIGRIREVFKLYRLLDPKPASMTSTDYDDVYDLINNLLCDDISASPR